ncbi:unnamed protein product [Psylliodes chrysocephalus]|uniref:CCHC-type domain-containing protein n=1 Tax=Psylliodes chrysocephalus TaxID=3402493 RepID=A0A9P0CD81_9CUCU|nr:unnamed protein product [Psylliodes chrysocephala]
MKMSNLKNTLPQEGRTICPESLSAQAGRPMDSGGDKNSSRTGGVCPDLHDDKARQREEEEKIIDDWSKKKNKIKRTPPVTKFTITPREESESNKEEVFKSCTDTPVTPLTGGNSAGFFEENDFTSDVFSLSSEMETSVGELVEKIGDEERESNTVGNTEGNTEGDDYIMSLYRLTEQITDDEENTTRKTKRKRVESPYAEEEGRRLGEAFKKVRDIAEMLTKLVGENSNTKREIKENIRLLDRAVKKLGKHTEDYVVMDKRTVRVDQATVTCTTGTQTETEEERRMIQTRECLIEEMGDKINGIEDIEGIIGRKWGRDVFKNTSVIVGNPGNPEEDENLVIVFDPESDRQNFNMAGNKEIGTIISGKMVERGGTAYLKKQKDLEIEGSANIVEERCIIFAGGDSTEGADRALFKSCYKIKEVMLKKSIKKTRMVIDAKFLTERTRKITEIALADTNIEVEMYDMGRKNEEGWKVARRPPKRLFETQALIIQAKGKSYADLLKEVRGKILPEEVGDSVKDLKKTRNGDLLITLNKEEDVNKFKNIITTKINGDQVKNAGDNRTLIYINDMDAITTKEDVAAAIEGIAPGAEVEVKYMRETMGGRQMAAVLMDEAGAKIVVREGRVKIGWSSCRVREKITFEKCFKCWKMGHKAAECKGPSREDRCRKCGGVGHRMRECENNIPYCWTCEEQGHTNTRCPRYQKALREEIRRANSR